MHFLGELRSTLVNFLTVEFFGFLNPVTLVYQVFAGFLFCISLSIISVFYWGFGGANGGAFFAYLVFKKQTTDRCTLFLFNALGISTIQS